MCVQDDICAKLGISKPLASALQAYIWVHQSLQLDHGSVRLLEQAKVHLGVYLAALTPPTSFCMRPSDVGMKSIAQHHGGLVLRRIHAQLLQAAKDAFQECEPAQVPLVFELVMLSHPDLEAGGQAHLLEQMLHASLDAELDRC